MNNGKIVEEFARVFLLAPDLAGNAISEALKSKGYEVTFKKVAHVEHPDPYHNFPIETGERSIASV